MDEMIWRKSSRSSSNTQACVELAGGGSGTIAARDSKDPDGPVLRFTGSAWRGFLADLKAGRYVVE